MDLFSYLASHKYEIFTPLETDKYLCMEAHNRGFYDNKNKYIDCYKRMCYGCTCVEYDTLVNKNDLFNVLTYVKLYSTSPIAKERDKECICGMLLSAIAGKNTAI